MPTEAKESPKLLFHEAAAVLYASYPEVDLVPVRVPPKDPAQYRRWYKTDAQDCGDTLFTFLARELAQPVKGEELTREEIMGRLDTAIADLQAVRRGFEFMSTVPNLCVDCGTLIGHGHPAFHLDRCDACAAKAKGQPR